ncbi:hypothetical protein N7495_001953 [Penicillium taxi]|uniref:uncharacterized protein n=1 Tax=Penicillium taxi TaxID=168475 RepID=UPI0025455310|nr:uncharacterized protein N7495_001953 [Penicillium taxi]KAJ5909271.1 hypothetical protein N7495_001953 [Penicillium taxi]
MTAIEAPTRRSSSMLIEDNVGLDDELRLISHPIPSLDEFCNSYGLEKDWILRFTWGLVLGIYSGESNVCFRCIRRGAVSNESTLEEWVHRMELDRSTPIIDLLKKLHGNRSCQNGGFSEDVVQDSALEGHDTVLMLNIGLGRASQVLEENDMANVGPI